jgi:hypothetical protein
MLHFVAYVMNHAELKIAEALHENKCSVINAWTTSHKNSFGHRLVRIPMPPEKVIKLEGLISEHMQTAFQKSLVETLEKQIPQIYIDCSKKWTEDIMFFIFRRCMEQIAASPVDVASIVEKTTIVTNRATRKNYIEQHKHTLTTVLTCYKKLQKKKISLNSDPNYKQSILNFESNITFDWLIHFLKHHTTRQMYLYLDNVGELDTYEQSRINHLLFARGQIQIVCSVYVKINNWANKRKSRRTPTGHRPQAPHDYGDTTIYEEDFEDIS